VLIERQASKGGGWGREHAPGRGSRLFGGRA
jgi:hypothetical protein